MQVLPSSESAETLAWNQAVQEDLANGDCFSASQKYLARDSTAVRVMDETALSISPCLMEFNYMDALKNNLAKLRESANPSFNSAVLNEKALLSAALGDTTLALKQLMMAIETENSNTFAKYNYEYLSKIYKPNRKAPLVSQNRAFNNEQQQMGGTVEKSEGKEDELDSTNPPKIDLPKALQVLDGMRGSEFIVLPIIGKGNSDTTHYGYW